MTKRIPQFILLILAIVNTNAQKSSASPYSFFGIGEENITKTVEEISMGEASVASYSSYQLFLSNPASLAMLSYTTYDLGLTNRTLKVTDANNSERSSATALSYLILGVPIGDKAGFAFGLQPNTNTGYSLLQQISDTSNSVVESNLFFGNGGTNRLFFQFGKKINKFASVGLESNFIFGHISNNILNRRNDVVFASQHEINSNVSGFSFKFGAQYHKPLKNYKDIELSIGATAELSSNYNNRGTELLFSLVNNPDGLIIPRDTIANNPFIGTIKNPFKSTIGIGFGKLYQWNLSLEYGYKSAIGFTGGFINSNQNITYKSANRLSLGGYYTPNFNSIINYWDRVTYRAGLKYNQSGLSVNNTNVNEFGISFGVGMPIGKELSTFNLGMELGKRGTINNGLVKENYFNLRLGLTLNDKWFSKRKIL